LTGREATAVSVAGDAIMNNSENLRRVEDGRGAVISAPLPRRLLILACSATKRHDPAPLPARDRYDGPLWRTLRAADPRGRRARVAFLSARYGFRDAQTPIEDYDARLSEDLARRMIAGGMTTRRPRPSPSRPDNYGMHPGAEIAWLTRYGTEPIDDVALAGGHLYLTVMRAMLEGFVDMGCVDANAHVVEINGPIGRMRRELRRWLLAVVQVEEDRP
jgi:hypothetical protein